MARRSGDNPGYRSLAPFGLKNLLDRTGWLFAYVPAGEVTLRVRYGGKGEPMVLLS
jgi:hypothetical protein